MEPTAADFDAFQGYEFDWFALDNTGVIGLFSTAGWGGFPVEVLRHAQAHRAITERFELPNYSSLSVNQDYGRLGLFLFDWQHWQGPYQKEAVPLAVMTTELRDEILRIPDLPQLNLQFEQVQSVDIPIFRG